jgi:hypothetical protein
MTGWILKGTVQVMESGIAKPSVLNTTMNVPYGGTPSCRKRVM